MGRGPFVTAAAGAFAVVSVAAVVVVSAAVPSSSDGAAAGTPVPATPTSTPVAASATATPAASGRAPTGALFGGPADDPGGHFCSASVVTSAAGNMVITAAHCVADGDGTPARTGMSFAPGYHDGVAPFGYWTVTAAAVGPQWLTGADPDDDVALLTVDRAGSPPIQQVTGAYSIDFSDTAQQVAVTAVGYNADADEPTAVSGTATPWSPTQLRLDEPGLDDGTSGGPLLTGPDGTEIVGVIGGYQEGRDTAEVSYAAALGTSVRTMFDQAGGAD